MILELSGRAGGHNDGPGLAPGFAVWAFLLVRGLGAVAWGLGAGDGLVSAG